jgi:hypothetical protein
MQAQPAQRELARAARDHPVTGVAHHPTGILPRGFYECPGRWKPVA